MNKECEACTVRRGKQCPLNMGGHRSKYITSGKRPWPTRRPYIVPNIEKPRNCWECSKRKDTSYACAFSFGDQQCLEEQGYMEPATLSAINRAKRISRTEALMEVRDVVRENVAALHTTDNVKNLMSKINNMIEGASTMMEWK